MSLTLSPTFASTTMMAASQMPTLDQVLVTVGDGVTISALGLPQGERCSMIDDPNAIGFAAVTAVYPDEEGKFKHRYYVDRDSLPDAPVFRRIADDSVVTIEELEDEHGEMLQEGKGPRILDRNKMGNHIVADIGAPLAYNLEAGSEVGGLRRHVGLTERDIKSSPLSNMARTIFTDKPSFSMSLQAQLFVSVIMGALLALNKPLRDIVNPWDFRIFASTCFPGEDSRQKLENSISNPDFSARLAGWLNTHGPYVASMMLSHGLTLRQMRNDPKRLAKLVYPGNGLFGVPQSVDMVSAACASSLISFCNLGNTMLTGRYGSANPPKLAVWASADAILTPPYLINEGFGPKAFMTSERIPNDRDVKTCFCPYDADAAGTFAGNGGAATIVTTAEFAMRHGLDITSAFLGWGTSAESGVPEHTSGVGYGGANAMILALEMAYRNFGVGVQSITRFNAHGTSTSVNSKTDLLTAVQAMLIRAVMERDERLPDDLDLEKLYVENKQLLPEKIKLAASKAAGHAHTMAPCGLISAVDGTYYLRGEKGVGVPNFRRLPDKVGYEAAHFDISPSPMDGNENGVEVTAVQGFGGPNGAIVRASTNPDFLGSLEVRGRNQERIRDEYLERAADIRSARLAREAWELRQMGWALRSAVENRWPDVIKL